LIPYYSQIQLHHHLNLLFLQGVNEKDYLFHHLLHHQLLLLEKHLLNSLLHRLHYHLDQDYYQHHLQLLLRHHQRHLFLPFQCHRLVLEED
jgi:hypothetical protein